MIPDDDYGVLNRLILNEKIDPSPEGILRALGFVHLYTSSGLHLIALESFLQHFFGKTLLAKRVLTVVFWFFLFLIWKLQDFRLGFARVLLIFFLKQFAKEKGLRWRVFQPLWIAFCFDFALRIEAGWQHYYLAILGGVLGIELAKKRSHHWFTQHVYLSVFSWLMTAPLDLFENHVISWMTPVWSLLTIPVISLFLYPTSVLSFVFLGHLPEPLIKIWNEGLGFFLGFVDWGMGFSIVSTRAMFLSASLAFLAVILRPAKIWIPVFVFLVLLFRFFPVFHESRVELAQLDVGQGDSLLIRHFTNSGNPHRVEMIDTGPANRKRIEQGVFRLTRNGVLGIDTLLLSHLDDDHAGGLRTILPWIPIGHVEVNPRFERTGRVLSWIRDLPSVRYCEKNCFKSGMIDWISNRHGKKKAKNLFQGNDLMGSVLIPLDQDTVYVALGDADQKQENGFFAKHEKEILGFSNRILKISHHGSRFSSGIAFLRKLNPSTAVLSVGRKNRYHHPHSEVIDHLESLGIPFHRTDQEGDFQIRSKVGF